MKKVYRQKGTVVAEQFDGSEEMCDRYWIFRKAKYNTELNIREDDEFYLASINGNLKINVGDWIVEDKELSALPPRVVSDYDFKLSYEEEK